MLVRPDRRDHRGARISKLAESRRRVQQCPPGPVDRTLEIGESCKLVNATGGGSPVKVSLLCQTPLDDAVEHAYRRPGSALQPSGSPGRRRFPRSLCSAGRYSVNPPSKEKGNRQ
jgi:hypothetical protein